MIHSSTHLQPSLSGPFHHARKRATLLLLLLLVLSSQGVSLRSDALLSSFAGSLGLGTFGVHFFLEDAFTLFLGFSFVYLRLWD
jgi:hypothetical protein